MGSKTVGFAIADTDRDRLDVLVDRYGHGNRSEFLREAMHTMEVRLRAERLADLQARAHDQVGHELTAGEIAALVARASRER